MRNNNNNKKKIIRKLIIIEILETIESNVLTKYNLCNEINNRTI